MAAVAPAAVAPLTKTGTAMNSTQIAKPPIGLPWREPLQRWVSVHMSKSADGKFRRLDVALDMFEILFSKQFKDLGARRNLIGDYMAQHLASKNVAKIVVRAKTRTSRTLVDVRVYDFDLSAESLEAARRAGGAESSPALLVYGTPEEERWDASASVEPRPKRLPRPSYQAPGEGNAAPGEGHAAPASAPVEEEMQNLLTTPPTSDRFLSSASSRASTPALAGVSPTYSALAPTVSTGCCPGSGVASPNNAFRPLEYYEPHPPFFDGTLSRAESCDSGSVAAYAAAAAPALAEVAYLRTQVDVLQKEAELTRGHCAIAAIAEHDLYGRLRHAQASLDAEARATNELSAQLAVASSRIAELQQQLREAEEASRLHAERLAHQEAAAAEAAQRAQAAEAQRAQAEAAREAATAAEAAARAGRADELRAAREAAQSGAAAAAAAGRRAEELAGQLRRGRASCGRRARRRRGRWRRSRRGPARWRPRSRSCAPRPRRPPPTAAPPRATAASSPSAPPSSSSSEPSPAPGD
eukprot:tig00021127_g18776.t1